MVLVFARRLSISYCMADNKFQPCNGGAYFQEVQMTFKPTQNHRLGNKARQMLGKLSPLIALRTRGISVETIRRLCGELYLELDEFLEMVDNYEKYNRKSDKNNG